MDHARPHVFVPLWLALTMTATACGDGKKTPTPDPQPAKVDVPAPKPPEPTRAQKIDPAAAKKVKTQLVAQQTLRKRLVSELPFSPLGKLTLPIPVDPGECTEPAPPPTIDVHRSLFVHDQATLNHVGSTHNFSLRHTFDQMAAQITTAGVSGVTAESLFRDFWDTQNDAANAATPQGAHCDDNGTTINGFANTCRVEGDEAKNNVGAKLDSYIPIGVVNRLDLASAGWSNCGEYRIVYARQGGGGRNLMIFEAVLPNPSPGCKDACRPVAEFWADLSTDDVATSRAEKLLGFYYEGLPGFRPVVHVDHYSSVGGSSGYGSAGGGQIRTNQFMQSPWTLKEMRTLIDCGGTTCEFQFVPDTVKLNPFGELWDPTLPTSDFGGRVGTFRAAIGAQVAALGSAGDVNSLSYELDDDFNGAQSAVTQTGDTGYCNHFGCGAGDAYLTADLAAFNASLPPGDQLSASQIVSRATALSCAGCHQPSTFGLLAPNALGPASAGLTSWPNSAGFVHTNENSLVQMPNPQVFGGSQGFALSPALLQEFLPHREQNLLDFLAEDDCPCLPRFVPRLPRDFIEELLAGLRPIPRPGPRPPRSLELHRRDLALEKLAVALGEKAGLAPVKREKVSLVPHTEKLREVAKQADPKKRVLERNALIRKRIAEQPMTKRADGTFRVH